MYINLQLQGSRKLGVVIAVYSYTKKKKKRMSEGRVKFIHFFFDSGWYLRHNEGQVDVVNHKLNIPQPLS